MLKPKTFIVVCILKVFVIFITYWYTLTEYNHSYFSGYPILNSVHILRYHNDIVMLKMNS